MRRPRCPAAPLAGLTERLRLGETATPAPHRGQHTLPPRREGTESQPGPAAAPRAGPRARRGASSPGGSGPSAAQDRLVLPRRGMRPLPILFKILFIFIAKSGLADTMFVMPDN